MYLEMEGVQLRLHSSKMTLQHLRMPIVAPSTLHMFLDPARADDDFVKLSEAKEGAVTKLTRGLYDAPICWQFDLHS